MTANSSGSRAVLQVAGDQYEIYRLDAVDGSHEPSVQPEDPS